MAFGFIYVASNDSFPGLYKIGMTRCAPNERLWQLSASTGVPTPFELVCAAEVHEPAHWETVVHQDFNWARNRANREFFRLGIEDLLDLTSMLGQVANFCWLNEDFISHLRDEKAA